MDISSYPDFAVICSFIAQFGEHLDIKLNFDQLEEWLLDQERIDDNLIDLHVKLIKNIRRYFVRDQWEKVLIKFAALYSYDDAVELETHGYLKTSPATRLVLLRGLIDVQFDDNDSKFKTTINEIEDSDLRQQPIGRDINGNKYWKTTDHEGNFRIYKEDPLKFNSWLEICRLPSELSYLIEDLDKIKDENIKGEQLSEEDVVKILKSLDPRPIDCTLEETQINAEETVTEAIPEPISEPINSETKPDLKPKTKQKSKAKAKQKAKPQECAIEPVITRSKRVTRRSAALAEQKIEAEKKIEIEMDIEMDMDMGIPTDDQPCTFCDKSNDPELILLCDMCDDGYHTRCCTPPLLLIPDGDWFCRKCEHKMLLHNLREFSTSMEVLRLAKEAERKKRARLRRRQPMIKATPIRVRAPIKQKISFRSSDDDDDDDDNEFESDENGICADKSSEEDEGAMDIEDEDKEALLAEIADRKKKLKKTNSRRVKDDKNSDYEDSDSVQDEDEIEKRDEDIDEDENWLHRKSSFRADSPDSASHDDDDEEDELIASIKRKKSPELPRQRKPRISYVKQRNPDDDDSFESSEESQHPSDESFKATSDAETDIEEPDESATEEDDDDDEMVDEFDSSTSIDEILEVASKTKPKNKFKYKPKARKKRNRYSDDDLSDLDEIVDVPSRKQRTAGKRVSYKEDSEDELDFLAAIGGDEPRDQEKGKERGQGEEVKDLAKSDINKRSRLEPNHGSSDEESHGSWHDSASKSDLDADDDNSKTATDVSEHGEEDEQLSAPTKSTQNPGPPPKLAELQPHPQPTYSTQNPGPPPKLAELQPQPRITYSTQNSRPPPTFTELQRLPQPTYSTQNPRPLPTFTELQPHPQPTYSTQNLRPPPTFTELQRLPQPTYSTQNPRPLPTFTELQRLPPPTYSTQILGPPPTLAELHPLPRPNLNPMDDLIRFCNPTHSGFLPRMHNSFNQSLLPNIHASHLSPSMTTASKPTPSVATTSNEVFNNVNKSNGHNKKFKTGNNNNGMISNNSGPYKQTTHNPSTYYFPSSSIPLVGPDPRIYPNYNYQQQAPPPAPGQQQSASDKESTIVHPPFYTEL